MQNLVMNTTTKDLSHFMELTGAGITGLLATHIEYKLSVSPKSFVDEASIIKKSF